MPRRDSCEMPDGRVWEVESDSDSTPSSKVLIPVDQLDGLSVEQIGKYVQLLIRPAKLCLAKELASTVDEYADDECWNPSIKTCGEWLAALKEFEKESTDILEAASILRRIRDELLREEEEARRRAELRKPVSPQRREVQINYEKLFVTLGRRDGFRCAICGSSPNDLQIDHIIPIVKNGTSDIGNLQLLCRSCNSRKKDKILMS